MFWCQCACTSVGPSANTTSRRLAGSGVTAATFIAPPSLDHPAQSGRRRASSRIASRSRVRCDEPCTTAATPPTRMNSRPRSPRVRPAERLLPRNNRKSCHSPAFGRTGEERHEVPRRGIPRRRERGCVAPSQRYGIPRFARLSCRRQGDDVSFEQLRVHQPSHRPPSGVMLPAMAPDAAEPSPDSSPIRSRRSGMPAATSGRSISADRGAACGSRNRASPRGR